MVPVIGHGTLLHEALLSVAAQAEGLNQDGAQPFAFCHWALGIAVPVDRWNAMVQELCDDLASGGRSLQALAALGFLLEIDRVRGEPVHAAFQQGVDWLVGRSGNSQTSLAALMHPVAHTGVLVGLLAVGDQEQLTKFATWFTSLNGRLRPLLPTDDVWRGDLLEMIERRSTTAVEGRLALPVDSAAAALYVSKDLATATATDTSGDEFTARLMIRLRSAVYRDAEQAALDLSAFRYLAQGSSGVNLRALSLDDVGLVLQRLPAGLRRWTWEDQKKTPNSTAQKWAVENEYHFQNLLYAVLAPVFHDLRDEEWLASVGQKKPRADLVIPSLHLVVEVKYWRVKHPPQDLISQIAEDVGLYLKRGSPYRKVLPIVWDQGRRTEQYDYLVSGLNEIRDIVTPVVIAQPGFMS